MFGGRDSAMKNLEIDNNQDKAAKTPASSRVDRETKIRTAVATKPTRVSVEKSLIEALYSEDDFNSCW
jgi:hypothetical protein